MYGMYVSPHSVRTIGYTYNVGLLIISGAKSDKGRCMRNLSTPTHYDVYIIGRSTHYDVYIIGRTTYL